ncbi:hypothetical protein GR702_21710 [Novosphingobium sp. FGD1]|uniref:Uncharacterized protein n=1 Tax=Novosphingobium silvae TaxID=2692619 RepID=A0A7X4K8M9_9SPHN|nr:hypothetical protein [Novosphingobium silvae]
MRGLTVFAAFAAATIAFTAPAVARAPQSDAEIKQRIIKQSIASYPGNCACPYNSASNGSRCGGRSAWNRGGGYAPMCFPKDVSAAAVKAYRASH